MGDLLFHAVLIISPIVVFLTVLMNMPEKLGVSLAPQIMTVVNRFKSK